MSKKRHAEEQELPFVALMDTMTNVVGVLVIVMVMIGITLARAASKVLSSLPPATEAQIVEVMSRLERLRAEQAPLQAKLAAPADVRTDPKAMERVDQELADLERQMKNRGLKPQDDAELIRDLARKDEELVKLKADASKITEERNNLKVQLDQTPIPLTPPAKVVRIPASRPIPKNAKIEQIVVTKDGAYWVDEDALTRQFLGEFSLAGSREAIYSQMKRGNKRVTIYDAVKLKNYFEKRKLKTRGFDVTMGFEEWSRTWPVLTLRASGAPVADLGGILWRIKHKPNAVVMFRVTGDGYDHYLDAREVCDKLGIPAGWEYAFAPEAKCLINEIETNRPVPAAKDKSDEIKPPAAKID
jgi:hypothetical protein